MNMGSVRELTKEEVRSMPAGSVTTIKDLMFMRHLPTGEGVPPGGPPQDAAASPGTPLAAFGAADAVPWGNEPIGFYDAYAAAILQARGDWLLEELHRTQVQLRELVPGARLVPAAWRDPSPLTAGPAAAQIVVASESSEGGEDSEDSEVSEDRPGHVAVASAPQPSAPLPRMLQPIEPLPRMQQPSVPPPRDEMPQPRARGRRLSPPATRAMLFDISARIVADPLSRLRLTRWLDAWQDGDGSTEAARSLPSSTQ